MVPPFPNACRLVEAYFSHVFSGWSYFVTPAYTNISPNVIETIQHIYSLLDLGCTRINLGPPLRAPSGMGLELRLNEAFLAAEFIGFEFLPANRRVETANAVASAGIQVVLG